jgi:hypothetical protein
MSIKKALNSTPYVNIKFVFSWATGNINLSESIEVPPKQTDLTVNLPAPSFDVVA